MFFTNIILLQDGAPREHLNIVHATQNDAPREHLNIVHATQNDLTFPKPPPPPDEFRINKVKSGERS